MLDVVSSPPWRDEAADELSTSTSKEIALRESASTESASNGDREERVVTSEGGKAGTQATDNSDTDDPTQATVLGEPADDHPAVLSVISHFGFPDSAFRAVRFVRRNRRGLHAVAANRFG